MTNSQAPDDEWHRLGIEHVARRLETDPIHGLNAAVAASRLGRHGPNEVETGERLGIAAIVLRQFTDLMIVILAAAAVVSGFLGDIADAVTIVAIILLNAIIGAVQEFRAQRAVTALRRMATPHARVVRAGKSGTVSTSELVPGDVVELQAGDVVPADLRVLDSHELSADESVLTGESLTVEKHAEALTEAGIPVGDRRNMVYRSTAITRGRGRGIVVATGLSTEIGRIASMLTRRGLAQTPLQRRLTVFGQRLALAVIGICALVFFLGIARGEAPVLMFLTAVSLAVAAIPEALPAVVTISLAFGAKALSRRQSLVRRLPAVETLGSVTYICTDKTGTLTENRMTLSAVWTADGQHPGLEALPEPLRDLLGPALLLCNELSGDTGGDPTERALAAAAVGAEFDAAEVREKFPTLRVFAFESERKAMSTLHGSSGGTIAFVKGAPEMLIDKCDDELEATGVPRRIDRAARLATADALARDGYRVLAVAMRTFEDADSEIDVDLAESHLTLLALVGLSDPIRPEVPDALADCRKAGITPVMITGDHPVTARRIADQLGMSDDDEALSGPELAALSDAELRDRARSVRVYARVDPEQKIRIVEALQANGEHVAMTGDGVNDAPALKQASIGIAMGRRGTDVAREAADIVLLDDNFTTILTAVKEGRRIYANIRKFIRYTMTSNAGEIWVLLLGPLLGLPIPLLPIHILWINLVTDGLPGLAYSAEPAERNVMRQPPRPPNESVFAHGTWQHMLWMGLMIAVLALITAAWTDTNDQPYWRTMVFTTLVTAQLSQALALRSEVQSLWSLGFFTNPYMAITIAATLAVQLLVVYLPICNEFLRTRALSAGDMMLCLGLGFTALVAIEIHKFAIRRMR